MNEEHLQRYAELLVHCGVGLRPRQALYILGSVAHRQLIALLTEVAYNAGAGPVESRLFDPLQQAALVRHGRPADIELSHTDSQAWYNEIVRHGAAYICLHGPEFPGLWEEVARTHPEGHALYQRGSTMAVSGFLRHGLESQGCPWVTAVWPTEGWARKVLPGLSPAEARDRLVELIFQFTFADQRQAFELTAARDRRLKARCRELDDLEITEIHLRGGQTDLRLGLSKAARWLGGSMKTVAGQTFYCNMPSVEVYTTPDHRLTEGRLASTRPLRLPRGSMVRDLVLRFQGGRVTDFDASDGREAFEHWLETDDAARRLGEIALVGEDSCIARSGLFFDLDLLDENASSHIALGLGFTRAVAGGESKSARELEALGFNTSAVHKDIMFGSPEVTVVATRSREGEVVLLERGGWVGRFATVSP